MLKNKEHLSEVFLSSIIIVTLLALWTFYTSFRQIKGLKDGKLEVNNNPNEDNNNE